MADQRAIETQLAQAGTRWDQQAGAVSMPIFQTATFAHPALGQSTGFDYSRTSNPTRAVLESALAGAEGGASAAAFGSGLAAVDALVRLLTPGDRMVVTEDLYGGSYRLFSQVAAPAGIEPIYVDTSDTDAVAQALAQDGVKMLFVETPTNPLLKIADIPALAQLAREGDVLFVVDNTFLTAVGQRPLEMGADLVLYSASKYLAGHNDVVAGALVSRTAELGERVAFIQNAVGAILGPMDSWLVLRGLKTLALRLERQAENAQALAEWLAKQPNVTKVYYPGLPDHPQRDRLPKGKSRFGAMLAFEVEHPDRVARLLEGVEVFLFAESLGGVESLITYPLVQTHADMDPDLLERLGINNRLLRVSVGIEHVQDLIADLEPLL